MTAHTFPAKGITTAIQIFSNLGNNRTAKVHAFYLKNKRFYFFLSATTRIISKQNPTTSH